MDRAIKKIIDRDGNLLCASDKSLSAIFEIMFSHEDSVLCESSDGFRIKKQTYGQMKQRILRAAKGLFDKIGAKGSFVALEMENSPEWIVGFWAILASGNKPYLVNTRYPESLTAGILNRLEIAYTLSDKIGSSHTTYLLVSQLEEAEGDLPAGIFEDTIAFSSSATSMKEVICFYHGKEIACQILNFRPIVTESPRMAKHYKGSLKQLAFLPFYHVFGLFAVYFWFTFFGRTLVFLPDYSGSSILKTCRKHEVTHIFAVPLLWHTVEQELQKTLRDMPKKDQEKFQKGLALSQKLQDLFPTLGPEIAKALMGQVCDKLFGRSVYFCINGGSYVRSSALSLINGLGYPLHNGYGMSEVGITSVELRRRPKDRNKNSIGRPFAAAEYRLDEEGVLWIKSGTSCVEKWVNGEKLVTEEWFCTGDRMSCEDGHYFIHGRVSDIVIGENGENINPDEIENRFSLQKAPAFSVLGLGEGENQTLSMVVSVSPYLTKKALEELRNEAHAINSTLPASHAVKAFYFTTDPLMPPSAIKVSRKQLQTKISAGEVKLHSFAEGLAAKEEEDVSPLLEKVMELVAKSLDLEKEAVTPDAHFMFDLGGSSLQYFSLLSLLAEEFSLTAESSQDKYCYTPREICEYIESRL